MSQRAFDYRELHARLDRWLAEVRALQSRPDLTQCDSSTSAGDLQRAALTLQTIDVELHAIRDAYQRLLQQTGRDRAALADSVERQRACTAIGVELGPLRGRLELQQRLALKKLSLAHDEQRKLEALIANRCGLRKQRLSRQLVRLLDQR
jgi:hypothetical protein